MVATTTRKPLGQLLLDSGLVSTEQLDHALEEQKKGNHQKLLGELLVELNFCTDDQITEALAGAYGVLGYNVYFYFAWFYLYLVNERGFSLEAGGFYTMAPFLTMAVAAPSGGWLSDAVGRRFGPRWSRSGVGCVCMLLTSVLVFGGAATDNAVMAVILLAASTGTLVLSVAAFWATTIDLAYRYAGTASAVMNMGGNLGGAVSPTLTPYLGQTYGWHVALYVIPCGIHDSRRHDPRACICCTVPNLYA